MKTYFFNNLWVQRKIKEKELPFCRKPNKVTLQYKYQVRMNTDSGDVAHSKCNQRGTKIIEQRYKWMSSTIFYQQSVYALTNFQVFLFIFVFFANRCKVDRIELRHSQEGFSLSSTSFRPKLLYIKLRT